LLRAGRAPARRRHCMPEPMGAGVAANWRLRAAPYSSAR
jgi:hypothetical protein